MLPRLQKNFSFQSTKKKLVLAYFDSFLTAFMDESTYRGPYSAIFTDIPKETLTDNLLPNVFVPNRNNSFKMMGTGLTRSQNNSFSLVCRDRLPEMWGSEKTHQRIKY